MEYPSVPLVGTVCFVWQRTMTQETLTVSFLKESFLVFTGTATLERIASARLQSALPTRKQRLCSLFCNGNECRHQL